MDETVLSWYPVIDSNFQTLPTSGKFSREEQLQWERKRLVTSGITSYEVHCESGKLIFPAAGTMFQCIDSGSDATSLQPIQIETCCSGARLNCQISPSYSELVAFVCNSDVWVAHTASGTFNIIDDNVSMGLICLYILGAEQRLTWVHTNKGSLIADPLSAGIPSYVIQEEFCRFQGFWWQPVATGNTISKIDPGSFYVLIIITLEDGIYRILYEEVDESDVGIVKFPSFNGDASGMEEYRFAS